MIAIIALIGGSKILVGRTACQRYCDRLTRRNVIEFRVMPLPSQRSTVRDLGAPAVRRNLKLYVQRLPEPNFPDLIADCVEVKEGEALLGDAALARRYGRERLRRLEGGGAFI